MTKSSTNLLGIFITILAGTYFYVTYCSECAVDKITPGVTVSAVSFDFSGTAENYGSGVLPCNGLQNFSLPHAYPLLTPSLIPADPSGSEICINGTRSWERMDEVAWKELSLYSE